MLYININDSDPLIKFLTAFQEVLGGTFENFGSEQLITISNDNAEGNIKSVPCNGGVGLIQFDISFKDRVCLNIDTSVVNILYFIYSLEGQFAVDSRSQDEEYITIKKFESVILSLDRPVGNKIYFEAGQNLNITIIVLSRALYSNRHNLKKDNEDPLTQLFVHGKENPVAFLDNYDIRIAQHVKALSMIESTGIIRQILVENKINEILAMQIQHYLDYGDKERFVDLTKNEIAKAMRLSEFIKDEPVYPHSIDSLSAKNGLSPAKLQKSFKYLYSHTVSDYVRDVRLMKAEDLIKTTDLSISEIVYAVGFNSRSYFSKIFKKKYKLSPKKYQSLFKLNTL